MIHLPKRPDTPKSSPQTEPANLLIDYFRAQGPAQARLRNRFGYQMTASLEQLAHPEDGTIPIGVASDSGGRRRNEDSAVGFVAHVGADQVMHPVTFIAVSDGVGGGADGDLASAIAIERVTDDVVDSLPDQGDEALASGQVSPEVEKILEDAIADAHYEIKTGTDHGGSTLTSALVIDGEAVIAHIGDSRAYALNPKRKDIELLTHDHRLVQVWHDRGLLTDEQLYHHPFANVLLRHLGGEKQAEVDIVQHKMPPGWRLLLCTDGISETLSEGEISNIARRSNHPQEACEQLISAAVAHGARDDVTAAMVEIPK